MKHYQQSRRGKKLPERPEITYTLPERKKRAPKKDKPVTPEPVLLTPRERVSRRGDSIQDRQALLREVQRRRGGIALPANVELDEDDIPHWEQIIASRAMTTWYDAELVRAAQLARVRAKIERHMLSMGDEYDDVRLLDMLSRMEIRLARELHVHTTATIGRASDSGGKLRRERESEEMLAGGDDLDAKPWSGND